VQGRLWQKSQATLERGLLASLSSFLGRAVAASARAVAQGPGEGMEARGRAAFQPRRWDKALLAVVRPHLRAALESGANAELSLHLRRCPRERFRRWYAQHLVLPRGPMPSDVRQGLQAFLNDLLARPYWRDLNNTTRKRIVSAIRAGLEAGEGPREVAERIRQHVGGNKARALLIARTEITAGLNVGQDVARLKLGRMGAINTKEWLALDDDDTRPDHTATGGQRVPYDGLFDVGGEEARFPGDPDLSAAQRCRCRCTCLSLFVE
jgi:hypothetical protein